MGFFSSMGRGILGAGTGFLTGGPVGAVAGGIAGLASNGGDVTRQTNNSSSTATRQTTARGMNPQEQALYDQSNAGLLQSGQSLTPDEIAKLRDERFRSLFGTASREINQAANSAQQSGYASNARRGLSGSTNSQTQTLAREGVRQNSLGRAATESNLGADQLVQQEQANRRANAAMYMANLNDIWNRVLSTSKITTTGNTSGNATNIAPDGFLQSAAAGIGGALTNDNSYYNKNGGLSGLFGGV